MESLNVSKNNPFKCNFCGKQFTEKDPALQHILTHSRGRTRNFCIKCGEEYPNVDAYEKHMKTHKTDNRKKFTCKICGQVFYQKMAYHTHSLSHHSYIFTCPKCSEKFTKKREFFLHIKTHKDLEMFECFLCHRTYLTATSLRRHMRTHAEKRFLCLLCNKKFVLKTQYREHMRSHIEDKKYKCDNCFRLFRKKQSLGRHSCTAKNLRNPNEIAMDFHCPCCELEFDSQNDLSKHMNENGDEYKIQCKLCEKMQKNCYALKRHNTLHSKDFKCAICESTFSRKFSYDLHMRKMHENDVPQECKVCGVILYKHSYRTHMMRHEGKKVYQCEECNKEYPHASSYFRHLQSHRDERNYECQVCGKKSLQKTHHLEHMRTHNIKKSFECTICQRGFNANYYYRKHMREVHSSETPFLCEVCGEAFADENEQIEHMKLSHAIIRKTSKEEEKEDNEEDETGQYQVFSVSEVGFQEDSHNSEESNSHVITEDCKNEDYEAPLYTPAFVECGGAEDLSFEMDIKSNVDIKFESQSQYITPNTHVSVKNDKINLNIELISFNDEKVNKKFLRNSTEVFPDANFDFDDNFNDTASEADADEKNYCDVCSEILPENNAERSNHLMNHHEFYCTICCKRYTDFNEYNNHLAVHGTDRIELTCNKCSEKFYDKNLFKKHLDDHELEVPVQCEYCLQLIYDHNFDEHMKMHTPGEPNQCKYCGRKCKSDETFRRHMEKHGGSDPKYKCEFCAQNFRKKTQYTRHLKMHTADKLYICDICKRRFYEFDAFKNHTVRIHNSDPFKCRKCSEIFNDDETYTKHKAECSVPELIEIEQKYNCAHCEASFTKESQIIEHLEEHRFKPTACDVCSRIFHDMKKYKKHIRIHETNKPFQCKICQRGFFERRLWRRHELQHNVERWHKCTKCENKFYHKIDLQNHLLKHDGKSAYKCDICSKEFTHRSSWRRHKQSHSGIKMFKCKDCGKEFRQSGHLWQHSKTHLDVAEYGCSICKLSFRLPSNMKRHMRAKHSSVTPFLCEFCGQGFADEEKRNEHADTHQNE